MNNEKIEIRQAFGEIGWYQTRLDELSEIILHVIAFAMDLVYAFAESAIFNFVRAAIGLAQSLSFHHRKRSITSAQITLNFEANYQMISIFVAAVFYVKMTSNA